MESVACDKLAHMIDIDNDGELSEKEITDKESHWRLMVMEADSDNDGRISVEEFVKTVTRSGNCSSLRGRPIACPDIKEIVTDVLFAVLVKGAGEAAEANCDLIVAMLDKNNDGYITITEVQVLHSA